jgi:hypothetical protein
MDGHDQVDEKGPALLLAVERLEHAGQQIEKVVIVEDGGKHGRCKLVLLLGP